MMTILKLVTEWLVVFLCFRLTVKVMTCPFHPRCLLPNLFLSLSLLLLLDLVVGMIEDIDKDHC